MAGKKLRQVEELRPARQPANEFAAQGWIIRATLNDIEVEEPFDAAAFYWRVGG